MEYILDIKQPASGTERFSQHLWREMGKCFGRDPSYEYILGTECIVVFCLCISALVQLNKNKCIGIIAFHFSKEPSFSEDILATIAPTITNAVYLNLKIDWVNYKLLS